MNKCNIIICTAMLLCFAQCNMATAHRSITKEELKHQFISPPIDYRPLPMYSFDYSNTQSHVKRIIDAGYGGANMQFPDQGIEYLKSPEALAQFVSAVETLNRNGLIAWIYDERGYPSGKAGSLVLQEHPEYEAQGLFYMSEDVHFDLETHIELPVPKGKLFYAASARLVDDRLEGAPVDLTGCIEDGILRTTVPAGSWRIMAFVQDAFYDGTHADLLGERYVNIMNPDATDRFLQLTYQTYFEHSKEYFGNTIKAFFTDEPSLMSGYLKEGYQYFPAISWYEHLPDAFRSAHKYDIKIALPALFNDVGPETARRRCDFYSTIADLVSQNYFGRIQDWCKAHDVESSGHLLWEESLIYHTNFYGSMMRSLAKLDIPGMDLLGCNYGHTSGSRTEGGPVTPKLISSSAHTHNKSRTVSESFCFVTKDTPLADMLSVVAWQWVLGINALTTLSVQNEQSLENQRALNDYTARLSCLLTAGDFVADVAVLYPIASVWADFVPINDAVWNFDKNPKAKRVDDCWQTISKELLANQRDFDYVDEESIIGATIKEGRMIINKQKYRIIILPNTTTLKMRTLQRIEDFIKSGGILISCGDIPINREDAGSISKFRKTTQTIWDDLSKRDNVFKLDSADELNDALFQIGDADLLVTPANPDIYYQHRTLPDADIYFVVNNSLASAHNEFRFRTKHPIAEMWDPLTGYTSAIETKSDGLYTIMSLEVPPRSGLFIVIDG